MAGQGYILSISESDDPSEVTWNARQGPPRPNLRRFKGSGSLLGHGSFKGAPQLGPTAGHRKPEGPAKPGASKPGAKDTKPAAKPAAAKPAAGKDAKKPATPAPKAGGKDAKKPATPAPKAGGKDAKKTDAKADTKAGGKDSKKGDSSKPEKKEKDKAEKDGKGKDGKDGKDKEGKKDKSSKDGKAKDGKSEGSKSGSEASSSKPGTEESSKPGTEESSKPGTEESSKPDTEESPKPDGEEPTEPAGGESTEAGGEVHTEQVGEVLSEPIGGERTEPAGELPTEPVGEEPTLLQSYVESEALKAEDNTLFEQPASSAEASSINEIATDDEVSKAEENTMALPLVKSVKSFRPVPPALDTEETHMPGGPQHDQAQVFAQAEAPSMPENDVYHEAPRAEGYATEPPTSSSEEPPEMKKASAKALHQPVSFHGEPPNLAGVERIGVSRTEARIAEDQVHHSIAKLASSRHLRAASFGGLKLESKANLAPTARESDKHLSEPPGVGSKAAFPRSSIDPTWVASDAQPRASLRVDQLRENERLETRRLSLGSPSRVAYEDHVPSIPADHLELAAPAEYGTSKMRVKSAENNRYPRSATDARWDEREVRSNAALRVGSLRVNASLGNQQMGRGSISYQENVPVDCHGPTCTAKVGSQREMAKPRDGQRTVRSDQSDLDQSTDRHAGIDSSYFTDNETVVMSSGTQTLSTPNFLNGAGGYGYEDYVKPMVAVSAQTSLLANANHFAAVGVSTEDHETGWSGTHKVTERQRDHEIHGDSQRHGDDEKQRETRRQMCKYNDSDYRRPSTDRPSLRSLESDYPDGYRSSQGSCGSQGCPYSSNLGKQTQRPFPMAAEKMRETWRPFSSLTEYEMPRQRAFSLSAAQDRQLRSAFPTTHDRYSPRQSGLAAELGRQNQRQFQRNSYEQNAQQNFQQNVQPNAQQNFRPNFQQNVQQNYPQNFQSNSPQNFPQNGQQNVPQNFQQNVQPNVTQNFQQNVQPNLPQNFQQNVQPNLPQNFQQNVQPNMPPNFQQNVQPNMPQNFQQNVQPNMPQNFQQNVQPNMPQNFPQNVQPNQPPDFQQNLPQNFQQTALPNYQQKTQTTVIPVTNAQRSSLNGPGYGSVKNGPSMGGASSKLRPSMLVPDKYVLVRRSIASDNSQGLANANAAALASARISIKSIDQDVQAIQAIKAQNQPVENSGKFGGVPKNDPTTRSPRWVLWGSAHTPRPSNQS